MEQLYQDYKDVAEFRLIYINEAHPADGGNPAKYATEKGLKRHTNFQDRCVTAEMLVRDKQLTIPCLIDGMDNAADLAYSAWPDKVFLVRKDGLLAIAGEDGPLGFTPALHEAEEWLAEFKETGKEPEIAEPKSSDFRIVVAGEKRPDGPQETLLPYSNMEAEKAELRSAQPVTKPKGISTTGLNRFLTLASVENITAEQLEEMADLRSRIGNIESLLTQNVVARERQLRKAKKEFERADEPHKGQLAAVDRLQSELETDRANLELFDNLSEEARKLVDMTVQELQDLAKAKKK